MSRTGNIKARVVATVFAIALINGLQHSLSPVLSSVHAYYPGVDVSLIQMLVTVPTLMAVVVALLTGWLALYISKKKIFLFAALVAGVTGLVPLLSDSFWTLFLFRALYGVALGIVVSLVTALVADFFDGEERVQVMGVQGASVGAGMVLVTTLAGIVGRTDFHNTYYLSILGFVAFFAILLLLPEVPVKRAEGGEKKRIRLNAEVWRMAAFLFAEGFFIIVYTTNLSMHLAGALKGDTAVAGMITGVFSAAQILMGVLLGRISRITGRYTLPVAMFALAAGYLLLVFFPGNLPILLVGAVFCGYSQSVYCAKAMAEVTTVVDQDSTPMASSLMTCALCLSQFVSPVVIGGVSRIFFGEVTTTGAYLLGSIGIFCVGLLAVLWKRKAQ
ncbi:MFS transporter [Eubacterium sp. AB3007]|uniref:MFS transporter n=1 Tax=Eubacterium sp. AB3007 TaxID=1392487 RepID=UPI000482704F|nr:MFS transporter [Eubacterium sp. AB3007]